MAFRGDFHLDTCAVLACEGKVSDMSRTKHTIWIVAIALSVAVFLVSLGSDVWEAYLSLVLGVSVAYGIAFWRSRQS